MPYTASSVPSYVPKAKAKQWAAIWNAAYQEKIKAGESKEKAEEYAFSVASGKIKNKKLLLSLILKKAATSELYEDTGEYDEEAESALRADLVLWADYAEAGPTYDSTGKYLCGSCDMRSGDEYCTRVVSPISFTTGSCRIYTKGKPDNDEPMPLKLTQIEAAYTERPEVKAYGCIRCQYGMEAKAEDSAGRPSWCSFWGLHIEPKACCFKNTGEDDVLAPLGDATEDQEPTEKTMIDVMKTNRSENEVQIFCPLVKVDVAKREVWGVVTAESPDKDGEICDYDTTVPYYKDVVSEMSKATDGANIFPLRAMHGLIAAGKGISIEFRKDAKEIFMGFKVVDDAEWKKVEENVYTGFSQGGRYIKKWKDGDNMRYTAKPGEVSLVDMPCLTRAHFDYIKADGTRELRKFSSTPQLPTGGEGEINTRPTDVPADNVDKAGTCACKCAMCAKGECTNCSADEKCAAAKAAKAVKYLVTSKGEKHLPYTKDDGKPDHRLMGAAWAALHDGFRGNKYNGPDKAGAVKRLKQLYAREGMDTPSEKCVAFDEMMKGILVDTIQGRAFGQLNKGMYTVSHFAQLTEDLKYLWLSMEYEREQEMDESPVTDEIKELYHDLLDHLLDYTEEQVAEAKEHSFA